MVQEGENPEPTRPKASRFRGQERSQSTGIGSEKRSREGASRAGGLRKSNSTPQQRRGRSPPSPSEAAPRHQGQQGHQQPEPNPAFQIGQWLWVQHHTDATGKNDQLIDGGHHAARVTQVTNAGKIQVKWAIGGPAFCPGSERIADPLTEREMDIVFDGLTKADGPHNGRYAPRTKVQAFLTEPSNLQGFPDNIVTRDRDDTGERSFSAILNNDNATVTSKIFAVRGLPWLVSSQTDNFSPACISTGKTVVQADGLPREVMHGKQDQAGPSYANCVGAVLSLMTHFEQDRQDPAYQKLWTLWHLLPALLLRNPSLPGRPVKATDLKRKIKANCAKFMDGQWKQLYSKAVEACAIQPRPGYAPPDGPAEVPPLNEDGVHEASMKDKVKRAEQQAEGGSFSSARQILCGAGISKDKNMLQQMQSKFPHADTPSFPPVDPEIIFTDDDAGDKLQDEIEKATGRQGMARLARRSCRVAAHDQWHMNPRCIIYPLLLNESIGDEVHRVFLKGRLEGYLPALYADHFRGGRLIPLSKYPKPGARPICIPDATRRLIHKAQDQVSKKQLVHFFESEYPNAIQVANGTKGGAEIKHNLIQMLLHGDMAPAPPGDDSEPVDDPTVIISIDLTNAFNEIDRQAIIDIVSGQYGDRTYDQGHISADDHHKLPNRYAGHWLSFKSHYGGRARMTLVNPADGSTDIVWCTQGVQQGDVIAGAIFNAAVHTIAGSVMSRHEALLAGFADNLDIVGKCSQAFPAAKDLITSLKEVGFRVNINESGMYAPAYHAAQAPPQAYLDAMQDPDMPKIPWAGKDNGLKLVGYPLGPEAFVRESLTKVRDDIRRELACMEHLESGIIHHHMLRMCQATRFIHHMRGLPNEYTAGIAREIDDLLWDAYKKYNLKDWDVPADPTLTQIEMEQDARTQFFTSVAGGGLGIAPNSAITHAAFYSGVAISLRMAAHIGARYPDLDEAIHSPQFQNSPFMKAFGNSRAFLLACPAGVTPEEGVQLRLAEAAAAAAAKAQGQKPETPATMLVIPGFAELYRHVGDGNGTRLEIIPDQKRLTTLARTHDTDLYKTTNTSQLTQARMAALTPTTVRVTAQPVVDSAFQQHWAPQNTFTRYSPLATFGSTAALSFLPFRRFLWATFVNIVLGLEYTLYPDDKCQCQGRDPTNPTNHDLSCKRWAAYNAAHEVIVKGLERLCISGGIPVQIGSKVPKKHPQSNECGDVHTKLDPGQRSEIFDVSVKHCTAGADEPIIEAEARLQRLQPAVITTALNNRHKTKVDKYRLAYDGSGHTFIPFVVSTRGPIHPEAQRLLFFIAQATTRQHMHYYTTDLQYETVMARNIQRVNAVASAAIGLSIAVRARGLARGNIGHDPPMRGWRMQDEITAAIDGPVDYAHLISMDAFGAPN